MSHGNAQTFPRLADVIGFITPDQLESAARQFWVSTAILAIARIANMLASNT